eukprot:851665-Heterocapsa_arctica.AAC.1
MQNRSEHGKRRDPPEHRALTSFRNTVLGLGTALPNLKLAKQKESPGSSRHPDGRQDRPGGSSSRLAIEGSHGDWSRQAFGPFRSMHALRSVPCNLAVVLTSLGSSWCLSKLASDSAICLGRCVRSRPMLPGNL